MSSQVPPPGRPGPVPPRPMPPRPPRPGPGVPTAGRGFPAPPPRPPVQSAYGPPGAPHGPAKRTDRLSGLAVAVVVAAVLVPPVGLVLGIVARRRIIRSAAAPDAPVRLTGRAAATAAILLGILLTLAEAVLALALFVAVPEGWLPTSDLPAASVQSTIEKTVPLPAGSVRCPGPLPAQIGASITCTGTQNGAPIALKATVSTVDGRDVRFDITRG
ncbi:DUF4333 domain-containing protein [Actinomycetospora sp.]|uniref:DUF4333 domain-containing protein n=1 Tax=Actinomycetospora sp. TaxID=1872135 RepID=UPI002F401F47